MARSTPFLTAVTVTLVVLCPGYAPSVRADRLSLLGDLKYDLTGVETTDKATGVEVTTDRSIYSQIYHLDMQKELFPTLQLSGGGVFSQDFTQNRTTDPAVGNNDTRETQIRPYLEAQFDVDLFKAVAGYHKSEIRHTATGLATERGFTEEYSALLNWKPVELPQVDLFFTRNLFYDDPLTNDQVVDNYQLRSKYDVSNYRFVYNHTTNDTLNRITTAKTRSNFDEAAVYFNRVLFARDLTLNSSLRGKRQQLIYSGSGDRLAPTTSFGVVIGNLNDQFPLTSDPDPGFSLGAVDLMVDSLLDARQLSFGLDFGTPTDLDRLFVSFGDLGDASSADFIWQVYIRSDENQDWTLLSGIRVTTNQPEDRFEFAFDSVRTRYIKIVTTPLAPPTVAVGENLIVSGLEAQRSLPPETSEFVTTEVTGDMHANWRLSNATTTGYDILYREQRSRPFDESKTYLTLGARLSHIFSKVFTGNLQANRSETRERGEHPLTHHGFSAGLQAKYLDTFSQSLVYSFTHENDEEDRNSFSNSILMRNNLTLYEGLSLNLDAGYSWMKSATGGDTHTIFARVNSNIVPNRWMNFTLGYGISRAQETSYPASIDQNGRIVATFVPTASLSLSADLSYTDKSGRNSDSTAVQHYFINWSPFREGTVFFSLSYGRTETAEDEKIWTLAPALHWQINRKALLNLEYAIGEREDRDEIARFDNVRVGLRVFY